MISYIKYVWTECGVVAAMQPYTAGLVAPHSSPTDDAPPHDAMSPHQGSKQDNESATACTDRSGSLC